MALKKKNSLVLRQIFKKKLAKKEKKRVWNKKPVATAKDYKTHVNWITLYWLKGGVWFFVIRRLLVVIFFLYQTQKSKVLKQNSKFSFNHFQKEKNKIKWLKPFETDCQTTN